VKVVDSKHLAKEEKRYVYPPHATAAVRLLLLTGCRLREILHLRWSEIDAQRGILNLPDSKTGRKAVLLSPAAMAIIERLPRIGVYVMASTSAGLEKERPLADLNRLWRIVRHRACLDGVRLHDLRHTHASIGLASGVPLAVIGRALGHKSPQTTARYAHLADDPLRAAVTAVSDVVGSMLGRTVAPFPVKEHAS
jgi:integrase